MPTDKDKDPKKPPPKTPDAKIRAGPPKSISGALEFLSDVSESPLDIATPPPKVGKRVFAVCNSCGLAQRHKARPQLGSQRAPEHGHVGEPETNERGGGDDALNPNR